MISFYKRTLRDQGTTQINKLEALETGVLIVAEQSSEAELAELAKDLGIDEYIFKDALDRFEVPRLEKDDGNIHILARFPVSDSLDIATRTCLISVTEKAVILVVDNLTSELKGLLDSPNVVTTQKTKLVLNILARINRMYEQDLRGIRRKLQRSKVSPGNVTERDILNFVEFESILNDYLTSLIPMDLVYKQLSNGKYLALYEADQELAEDLDLATDQLINNVKSSLTTISNLREAYSVVATNSLNRSVKTLTVLTILLTIPTITTGFFGMNVPLPLQNSPYAIYVILTGMFLLMALVGRWAFRRM
jgi:magnesium transporter